MSLASFEGGASLGNCRVGVEFLGRPSRNINHARGSAFRLCRRETPPPHVLSSPPYNFRDTRRYNSLVHSGVARFGLCKGDFLSHPSPFFKDVYSPQGNFRETSHFRPLPLKPFAKEEIIQNGRSDEGCEMCFSGSLGSEARPQRCILQHLAERSRFEIPRFRPGKEHFTLPSPSIQTLIDPLGIHKAQWAERLVL